MTRKELIRLAREAGLDIPDDDPAYNLEFNLEELGVFARLITKENQDWIASLEQNARDADRMYKELEADTQEVNAARIFLREKGGLLRDLAASQAHIKVLREALENCRLLAARHRKEDWALRILIFCDEVGCGGSITR